MIRDADLDGVSIVTPGHTHVDLTLQAVSAGVLVLLEKPIADSAEGADQLLRQCAEGTVLPGHVLRFNPAHREFKRRLDAGAVGRLLAISASRDRENGHRRYGEPDPAFLTQIHDLDLAAWLDGALPHWVSSISDVGTKQRSAVFTNAVSTKGTVWSIRSTWLRERDSHILDRLDAFGTEGSIHLESNGAGTHVWSADSAAVDRWPAEAAPGLGQEVAEFLALLQGSAPCPITLVEGRAAVHMAAAVRASARTGGRRVDLAEL